MKKKLHEKTHSKNDWRKTNSISSLSVGKISLKSFSNKQTCTWANLYPSTSFCCKGKAKKDFFKIVRWTRLARKLIGYKKHTKWQICRCTRMIWISIFFCWAATDKISTFNYDEWKKLCTRREVSSDKLQSFKVSTSAVAIDAIVEQPCCSTMASKIRKVSLWDRSQSQQWRRSF